MILAAAVGWVLLVALVYVFDRSGHPHPFTVPRWSSLAAGIILASLVVATLVLLAILVQLITDPTGDITS